MRLFCSTYFSAGSGVAAGNNATILSTTPPLLSTTYDSMQRSEGYSSFFQFSATQSNSQKVSSHFQKTAVDEVTSFR